jgi:hypothetical protein
MEDWAHVAGKEVDVAAMTDLLSILTDYSALIAAPQTKARVTMEEIKIVINAFTGLAMHGPDVGPIADWLRSIGVEVEDGKEE